MFIMNKTNEYNYVPNQVNIRIRIRIRDIRFVSYPTTFKSESLSELKCGKKCYPDPIPCILDPIPSLPWSMERLPLWWALVCKYGVHIPKGPVSETMGSSYLWRFLRRMMCRLCFSCTKVRRWRWLVFERLIFYSLLW